MKRIEDKEEFKKAKQEAGEFSNRLVEEAAKAGYTIILGLFHNESGVYTTEAKGNMVVMNGMADMLRVQVQDAVLERPQIMAMGSANIGELLGDLMSGTNKGEGEIEV